MKRKNPDFKKPRKILGKKLKPLNETVVNFKSSSLKSDSKFHQTKNKRSLTPKDSILSIIAESTPANTKDLSFRKNSIISLSSFVENKTPELRALCLKALKPLLFGEISLDKRAFIAPAFSILLCHTKAAIASTNSGVQSDSLKFVSLLFENLGKFREIQIPNFGNGGSPAKISVFDFYPYLLMLLESLERKFVAVCDKVQNANSFKARRKSSENISKVLYAIEICMKRAKCASDRHFLYSIFSMENNTKLIKQIFSIWPLLTMDRTLRLKTQMANILNAVSKICGEKNKNSPKERNSEKAEETEKTEETKILQFCLSFLSQTQRIFLGYKNEKVGLHCAEKMAVLGAFLRVFWLLEQKQSNQPQKSYTKFLGCRSAALRLVGEAISSFEDFVEESESMGKILKTLEISLRTSDDRQKQILVEKFNQKLSPQNAPEKELKQPLFSFLLRILGETPLSSKFSHFFAFWLNCSLCELDRLTSLAETENPFSASKIAYFCCLTDIAIMVSASKTDLKRFTRNLFTTPNNNSNPRFMKLHEKCQSKIFTSIFPAISVDLSLEKAILCLVHSMNKSLLNAKKALLLALFGNLKNGVIGEEIRVLFTFCFGGIFDEERRDLSKAQNFERAVKPHCETTTKFAIDTVLEQIESRESEEFWAVNALRYAIKYLADITPILSSCQNDQSDTSTQLFLYITLRFCQAIPLAQKASLPLMPHISAFSKNLSLFVLNTLSPLRLRPLPNAPKKPLSASFSLFLAQYASKSSHFPSSKTLCLSLLDSFPPLLEDLLAALLCGQSEGSLAALSAVISHCRENPNFLHKIAFLSPLFGAYGKRIDSVSEEEQRTFAYLLRSLA